MDIYSKQFSNPNSLAYAEQYLKMDLDKNKYLGGLQFQTKSRYFPQIAKKTNESENVMIPQNNMGKMGHQVIMKGQEKREKNLQLSFFQTQVPHSGTWINRNATADAVPKAIKGVKIEEMPPAGIRLPKTYKLNYPDNIPKIVSKLQ